MKKLICSVGFIMVCCTAFAQKNELGIFVGASNYKGELNPIMTDVRFAHPAAGFFYRYNISRYFASRTAVYAGTISGDDALSSDPFQKNRNLNFRSNLFDITTHIEFNFFPYQMRSRKYPFAPFVFVGIGLFKFNPTGLYTNPYTGQQSWEELQPLGTEGQGTTAYPDRKEYALTQICIPFGGGIKFNLGSRFGMGLEVSARKVFTDYLDDVSSMYADPTVLQAQNGPRAAAMGDKSLSQDNRIGSQRGSLNDNDWYMYAGLTVYFTFDKRSNGCDAFRNYDVPAVEY